jgi:excinuclease ABC subunit A
VIRNGTQFNPADGVIAIHGAREHNLKNISLDIPRGKFVVITGVSGSGKSTLAFDLLFAEGQRRFLDSMSAYARQFVEQLARPDVDLVTGIPPTVSIEQRNSTGGGKSTVATVTEVYHFIRLLFARLGTQFCPQCQLAVEAQTRDGVSESLRKDLKRRGDLLLLAPVVKSRKGFHTEVAAWAAKRGYAEIRADGKIVSTAERLRLDRFREHTIEIVTGVLDADPGRASSEGKTAQQLIDETIQLGHGTLLALDNHGKTSIHSTLRACPGCGQSFEPLDPKDFSYNSSQGWCTSCRGFGELFYLPDVDRGARADAIEESWFGWQEGEREPCTDCGGSRLNKVARAVRLRLDAPAPQVRPEGRGSKVSALGSDQAMTVEILGNASVDAAFDYFAGLRLQRRDAEIARDIIPEIRERLRFLRQVGLGYLQLGRGATTLSGGEAQRIRLAAQLGSNLCGVLYVLDEPTIGLHARDNAQLLEALKILKDRGNTLVVVEHDEQTMRCADYIIDLGPGAGVHGGQVVAGGTLEELSRHPDSITGKCLREHRVFPHGRTRRPVVLPGGSKSGRSAVDASAGLTLTGVSKNNLRKVDVFFPLNRLVVVTGVSGSGKSTLVRECLFPKVKAALQRGGPKNTASAGGQLSGHETLRAVYEVDQSPIGRTPRSIPATYVGFFDEIRRLFSQTPEARLRGYSPSRFSFNSKQGRCPECEGTGTIKLELSFMPPAFVRCESCDGTRFNRETLDIELREKNIAQVLELSVDEALQYFDPFKKIARPLEALRDTGLDYLKLGQISPTLSGGEAQRLKLVTHLLAGLSDASARIRPDSRKNLFILEEPTIGLHIADVQRLVDVLHRLVDAGHSVIVIEHNLELIAEADWVIDLGPEGGGGGGRVVAEGTPEQVAKIKRSHTGRFLHTLLSHPCPRPTKKS